MTRTTIPDVPEHVYVDRESIIDPDLPIVDAHHHLFDLPGNRYLDEEMLRDATSGHNIVATVYCETQAFVRQNGPVEFRPLGEVEFANGVGAKYASGRYGALRMCAGIVGFADLTLGTRVGALLDRCAAAAPERYRGVRQVTIDYPDERPFRYIVTHRPPAGILENPEFYVGLAEVAKRGLTFDAAVFNPSLSKVAHIADRFPDLNIVLNHMGTAVGVDMTPQEREDVFRSWAKDLRSLAKRPNVRCKIGGLGMPMWGLGFDRDDGPAEFTELAEKWAPFVLTAVEAFGPDRCMMEGNFPPDRRSASYVSAWNALKYITSGFSSHEKALLFHRTAIDTYRLDMNI